MKVSDGLRSRAISFLRAPAFSSAGFTRGAIVLSILFLAAHVAGLREHTRFLSGSEPPGADGHAEVILGFLYALFYFGFVLAAPILVIAAGLLFAIEAIAALKKRASRL